VYSLPEGHLSGSHWWSEIILRRACLWSQLVIKVATQQWLKWNGIQWNLPRPIKHYLHSEYYLFYGQVSWVKRSMEFFFCIHSLSVMPITAVQSFFDQNSKPGTREIPLLFSNDPKGSYKCMNHGQSTHHSAFDKPVKLCWWTCG
jgi:hypothetical protein